MTSVRKGSMGKKIQDGIMAALSGVGLVVVIFLVSVVVILVVDFFIRVNQHLDAKHDIYLNGQTAIYDSVVYDTPWDTKVTK